MLSNLLEPGQVLAGAPTATPTVVWAPKVPPGPQWLMDFVAVGAFATPVKDQVLIYAPESREAIVCKFLAQGNYAIARHQCNLNFATLQGPGCFHSPNALSNQLSHSDSERTVIAGNQMIAKMVKNLTTDTFQ